MVAMSYLSVVESYNDYKTVVHDLISSILTGVDVPELLDQNSAGENVLRDIDANYPFVELLYTLNEKGIQTSENYAKTKDGIIILPDAKHTNRSQRPYFKLADNSHTIDITAPYMSATTGHLCLSAALKRTNEEGEIQGYLVIDIHLTHIIEFLRGDELRRKASPFFCGVYSLMVVGLMGVAGIMLYIAFQSLLNIFPIDTSKSHPPYELFEVIIFITLSLAIFDLGKTILEEEVLMHKDVFRHSSTRRTITRFLAAILIAVSIEALLSMFKASLGDIEHMNSAVYMMLSVVGLLLALGGYVYLGAKAERILLSNKMDFGRHSS